MVIDPAALGCWRYLVVFLCASLARQFLTDAPDQRNSYPRHLDLIDIHRSHTTKSDNEMLEEACIRDGAYCSSSIVAIQSMLDVTGYLVARTCCNMCHF